MTWLRLAKDRKPWTDHDEEGYIQPWIDMPR